MKHYLISSICLLASISLLGQQDSSPQRQIGLWGGIGVGRYINLRQKINNVGLDAILITEKWELH